ncbi:transposable element Tcb2 transposase [Trichonephila clavipes]|nr:transposable element Tcb2 transposase [Trichonephila clavipes]
MKCPPGKDSWCFYRRALAKEYNFGTLKALKEIQKAANLDLGEEAVKIAATRDYRRKKKEIVKTGSAGRRPGQGRRRATMPNEDRYLVLTARRHRNMNATLLQQHLRSATGTTVSTQTVRNRLHGVGMNARQPMVCVRLTSRHRRDRREWAIEHVKWRRNEWSSVLFSDESRFSVHPDNDVFSSGGTVAVGIILRSCTKVSNLAVLVYGGISIDGRTDLYIIRGGPLTAHRYRDEILRLIAVPYAAAIGDDFILMDDNCRPHRANLEEDFLFRGRNRTNGMASVFFRHESNRARLERCRKTSCWPPTTPKLSKNWKELFWKNGTENTPTRD